jgi:hypothetical protein
MPHNAVDVLEDHLRLQLDRFRNVQKDKRVWGSTAMRYSRRLAAFLYIEGRSRTIRNNTGRGAALLTAAKRIDAEKGDLFFSRYLSEHLTRKTRNSNQRGIKRPRAVVDPTTHIRSRNKATMIHVCGVLMMEQISSTGVWDDVIAVMA